MGIIYFDGKFKNSYLFSLQKQTKKEEERYIYMYYINQEIVCVWFKWKISFLVFKDVSK